MTPLQPTPSLLLLLATLTTALLACSGEDETREEHYPAPARITYKVAYVEQEHVGESASLGAVAGEGEVFKLEHLSLSSYSSELVPCEEIATQNAVSQHSHNAGSPWLQRSFNLYKRVKSIIITDAYAGHAEPASPWQTTTGLRETFPHEAPLVEPHPSSGKALLTWEVLDTTLDAPQRFCHLHYLVARADDRFPDLLLHEGQRTSLVVRGAFAGRAPQTFSSAINYGKLIPLDPPVELDASSRSTLTIVLEHDLQGALHTVALPIQGGLLDQDELSRRLIRALVDHTSATATQVR